MQLTLSLNTTKIDLHKYSRIVSHYTQEYTLNSIALHAYTYSIL